MTGAVPARGAVLVRGGDPPEPPDHGGAVPVPRGATPRNPPITGGAYRARPPTRPARPARRQPARGNQTRRLGITLLAIVFVLSLFAGRLVQLQAMESGNYRKLASQERDYTIPLPALRGSITGANGQVLAMTVATYLVMGRPDADPGGQAAAGGRLAGRPARHDTRPRSSASSSTRPRGSTWCWPRACPPRPAARSRRCACPASSRPPATRGPTRRAASRPTSSASPASARASSTGGAGLELQHNALLAGRSGSEQVQIGTDGQQIPLAGSRNQPVVNGSSLRLTIVPALQYAAEQACANQVKKTKADNCTVVIIQPKTGAVLAMAQYPTYNPSDVTNVDQTTNLAVQAQFQPGSTAKVITASAALERGGQTPMSAYKIPYQIREGGQFIHDAEWAPGEHYTIAGIIAHSSNIGMSQVAKHISEQTQYDYLRAFGLGQPTGVGLPNESDGDLPPVSQWYGDTRYTLAFGQGVAATAMQMAEVYATIANDGVRVQPTLVEGTTNSAGKYTAASPSPSHRVIQAKTAKQLLQIMQQVPGIDAEGNQPWGVIPGYAVAAKTGTSQESNGKCALCIYGSSWIGIAPGDKPQLVVSVNVQNPRKGGHFGAIVACPVFYQVMKDALATLQIPPDGATPAKVRLNAP